MLTEECEELISKIFTPPVQNKENSSMQENSTILSSNTLKENKSRLEQEYLDLCIEIERQQKELENYHFKVKVANKEAEYYSRQIKEKEEILRNL